jgi:hypothetical protein
MPVAKLISELLSVHAEDSERLAFLEPESTSNLTLSF